MDDEIVSMTKFGVYKALPRSAAGNRKILGASWIYKRKVNKFGEVYRYRARLVAQGFRQKAHDSYDPDQTFSPVIHKDSLRMFLSVCAAENLRVYQADVKAALIPFRPSVHHSGVSTCGQGLSEHLLHIFYEHLPAAHLRARPTYVLHIK